MRAQPDAAAEHTAASWKLSDLETQDGRFVGLAISGGGSRAANFGAAVMLQLQQRGLLQQVDVISGVSGGTLPAVYYGLGDKAGPFTDEAVRKALGYDFQSSWIRRWFLPQNIFRYWLSDFTVGAHVNEAVLQLGPPAREHKTEKGEIAMAWDETHSRYIDGIGSTYTNNLVLTADSDGIIGQVALPGCGK